MFNKERMCNMTISVSGTGPQPFDSIQNSGFAKKIEKLDPKSIKVFQQQLNENGEYIQQLNNKRLESISMADLVNLTTSMKDLNISEESRNRFSDEMKADIDAGMSVKEFFDKYHDELKNIKHGL